MNYSEISKETVSYLYKSHASLHHSMLEASIRILMELRVSQINGCAYCCGVHMAEARKANIAQEKLDALPAWSTANIFTPKEIAALKWCEDLTCLDPKTKRISREELAVYFSEKELVDLTLCISLMNALNRLAISLKD